MGIYSTGFAKSIVFHFSVSSLMAVSLKDWDVKEQEGLWEVEKILCRADEILAVSNPLLASSKLKCKIDMNLPRS